MKSKSRLPILFIAIISAIFYMGISPAATYAKTTVVGGGITESKADQTAVAAEQTVVLAEKTAVSSEQTESSTAQGAQGSAASRTEDKCNINLTIQPICNSYLVGIIVNILFWLFILIGVFVAPAALICGIFDDPADIAFGLLLSYLILSIPVILTFASGIWDILVVSCIITICIGWKKLGEWLRYCARCIARPES